MTRGIFFRHVLREIALATLVVGLVLLVVLVTYQFAFVLGRAADGQLPGSTVPQLVALTLRSNLQVILPFTVLLGIVIGFGRLYHDNEIAAAQACGVGNGLLLAAAGLVTGVITLLAAWVSFVDGPAAARGVVKLRTEALRTAATRQLTAGSFRTLGSGVTLHFGASAADGSLRDVFVQRDLPATVAAAAGHARMQVVLAREARYALAPSGDAWLIDLADGHSYEGVPGMGDWRVTQFAAQRLKIPLPQVALPGRVRTDGLSNRELLASVEPRRVAELQWRIGWVLIVAVLGLAAVPLARLAPRQGRHARLPWAVLLFAVYAGLLISGRSMLERSDLPLAAGLWWVPLLVLGLALLIQRAPRLLRRLRA
jgi:lipopolysaccharide export system permease protein